MHLKNKRYFSLFYTLFIFFIGNAHCLTLEIVVKHAILNHPEIKIARNQFNISGENVRQSLADYFPSLDLASSFEKHHLDTPATRNNSQNDQIFTSNQTSLLMRQSIFTGFTTSEAINGTKLMQLAEKYNLQAVAERLALRVIEVFITLSEKRKQIRIAAENYKLHDKTYNQIKARVNQGLADNADLYQIEGRRARSHANLLVAQNNLKDAEIQYRAIFQMVPKILSLPKKAPNISFLTLEGSLKKLETHPQFLAIKKKVEASEHAYLSKKGAFYPQVSLEVKKSWGNDLSGVEGQENNYQITATTIYNLFKGGKDKAALLQAAYKVQKDKNLQIKSYLKLKEKLETAWSAHVYLQKQLPLLKSHLSSSRKTTEAYQAQFSLAQRGLLDVLDSANESFKADSEYIKKSHEYLFSTYRILATAGILLPTMKLDQLNISSN